MNDYILKVSGLTKCYNTAKALDNVTMTIEKGKIYGFIGQNGAGKTTTIRMLTGLAHPTDGVIEIFGKTSKKDLEKARKKIGTLVEKPILHEAFTARENLAMQSILFGQKNKQYIEGLLGKVGLADVQKKKVKDFSLGMKQRLGIAMAMVQEPEILILDEPVNGLDPMGMVDVRELLKALNKEYGITIMISSHILAELYQLATDYIIINNGKIIEQLTLSELDLKCKKHIYIETDEIEKAEHVIKNILNTDNYIIDDQMIRLYDCQEDCKKVAKAFFDERVLLTTFKMVGENLEEYFMELLGGNS